MIKKAVLSAWVKLIKHAISADLKIMDACEKDLDAGDIEHREAHAQRRMKHGQTLGYWQDQRDAASAGDRLRPGVRALPDPAVRPLPPVPHNRKARHGFHEVRPSGLAYPR